MATSRKQFRVDTRGIKKMVRQIDAMLREAGEANASGVRVAGEAIMTDVKASGPGKGVPVDEGALRSSGRVLGPNKTRGEANADLVFGNAAAPYALYQHERTDLNHKVGEARYLIRGAERFAESGDAEKILHDSMDQIVHAGKKAS